MAGYQAKLQQRMGFYCSKNMSDRLEAFAKKNDLSLTETIRQAVEAFLDSAEA